MKQILLSLTILFIGAALFAQAPQSFKYQTVVRDAANEILDDQNVYFKISILQYTDDGIAVYVETFDRTTNDFGLVTFNIGEGDVVGTEVFEDIDWSDGPYFVKVEVDIDGPGGTYDYEETGTSELLSVPYALYAKNSADAFSGDYDELSNVPATTITDSIYFVEFDHTEEDYIDFGTFENFTNSSDWSVIEKVMMPSGTGAVGGWHFFRGFAWGDMDGDIAIEITSTQIHAWVQQGTWKSVTFDSSFEEEVWHTICFQYDASANTLSLFYNGSLVNSLGSVLPQDDSGNTNKLFWGGQDVASGAYGDLYSEESMVFAAQQWFQRLLAEEEIKDYDGYIEDETGLFFSAVIGESSVTDGSGNEHDGTNGNSPEYIADHYKHTDFEEDLYVDGKVTIDNDLTINGSIDGVQYYEILSSGGPDLASSGIITESTIDVNSVGISAALYITATGNYEEADADAAATMPCVALALETGTGNKKVLLQGYFRNDTWDLTPGGLVYVSADTGALTQTIPITSGQQVQIVGYATATNTIYFNPNLMLIEID